ncbi:MAG: bifunctional nuclease family protein [Chthoniobacterales bacterium]
MKKNLIPVRIHAVIPTNNGSAVFIGDDSKVFVIYIDTYVATAISMFINGTEKERPLTHDLIGLMLKSFGAKLDRVIINDIQESTYFARMILSAENEIMHKKIIELDTRPSDAIALACQQRAPVFVTPEVWEQVEDMREVLSRLSTSQSEGGENDPSASKEFTEEDEDLFSSMDPFDSDEIEDDDDDEPPF